MILYVNGDSHAAGAQAVNNFSFANDDFTKVAFGRKPHPENLLASWGFHLSKILKLSLICDAEAGCSNERILRTTYDFLRKNNEKKLVIIGWTNWTRTEWLDEELNELVQINASFEGSATQNLKKKYKQYVANLDFTQKQIEWNDKIFELHQELVSSKTPHLFFNANDDLNLVPNNLRKKWKNCYINPYAANQDYISICTNHKFIHNEWYHFKQDAHQFWARFLFKHLTVNNINI